MNTNSPESNINNSNQVAPNNTTENQNVSTETTDKDKNSSEKKENICDQFIFYRNRYLRVELGLKLIYQVFVGFFMLMLLFYLFGDYISFVNTLQNLYEFISGNIKVIIFFVGMYIALLILIFLEVFADKSETLIYRFVWCFAAFCTFFIFLSLSFEQEIEPLKNEDSLNQIYLSIGFVLFMFVAFYQYIKHYMGIRDYMAELKALDSFKYQKKSKDDKSEKEEVVENSN
ncbi:hypothetical protein B0187_04655 [Haemophilus paracuniculus]|uniref:Uncharacterized protein n=1 Tax=Haemophilus paracuniculus TaxID=734 RepID=A0A1T0ATH0_9PAST|nr:hypothetical protein [Haemophilus paracuniculus]OOR99607.1 hypothetical protein B0187_04655 [Haemophilus paracuniculus]